MRRMTLSTLLADTLWPNSCTRHMRTCRCPHPLGVRSHTLLTNGSRSGRVTCAGRESSRQYVDRASPDTASRCASWCPCPASRFTSAALSRLVTSTPAGHAIFPGRRPSPPGTRAARPAPARAWQPAPARWMNPGAGPWPGAAAPRRPPRTVLAAPALQRRNAGYMVPDRHPRPDQRHGPATHVIAMPPPSIHSHRTNHTSDHRI